MYPTFTISFASSLYCVSCWRLLKVGGLGNSDALAGLAGDTLHGTSADAAVATGGTVLFSHVTWLKDSGSVAALRPGGTALLAATGEPAGLQLPVCPPCSAGCH